MASIDDVLDISPRVQYTAGAAQTIFAYPFPIFVNADLVVDVDGVLQVLTTDYTVSGAGAETGGNVTFLVGLVGGETVTIYRDIAIERLTDFQQNGPWSSTTFNDELDKLTLVLQELENKVGRGSPHRKERPHTNNPRPRNRGRGLYGYVGTEGYGSNRSG